MAKKIYKTELDWAFPEVDSGAYPLGGRVLLQMRRVKMKSEGGIVLIEETKEIEKWNSQIAKVIAVGPLAFRKRNTLELWDEGVWASPGEYVRVPKYGGDRWEVPVEGEEEPALFVVFNDYELIAKVHGNPLEMRAYI